MTENDEEFNERFETVEQALKYIADSQAKSEFIRKKAEVDFRKWVDEMKQMQANTQKHLDHITKVVRVLVEENEDKNGKIEDIGKILVRK